MSLTTQTDSPELVVSIGGVDYQFSQLPVGTPEKRGDPLYGLARLQAWVNAHFPNPIHALRGQLDGLPEPVQVAMGLAAREEAKGWPPQVGTAAGAAALLGSEPGQIEALAVGLIVHHPELTRRDVERIYRQLRKDAGREARRARTEGREYDGEGAVRQIFATLFGLDDGEDLPKANGRGNGKLIPAEASTGT